jgi:DNA-directed RNA polymerase I subunit RPA2
MRFESKPSYVAPDTGSVREEEQRDWSAIPAPLRELVAPHIESFDWFCQNVAAVLQGVPPRSFTVGDTVFHVMFAGARLSKACVPSAAPLKQASVGAGAALSFWPADARQGHRTFDAPLQVELRVCWHRVGELRQPIRQVPHKATSAHSSLVVACDDLWRVPVMVKSAACPLQALTPLELIRRGEEPHELGGYFIVNGNEKLLRMTVMQRRHVIVAKKSNAFLKRGRGFTPFATAFRSVCADQSSITNSCHFMREGGVVFRILIKKIEYFFPAALLLKGLCDCTDRALFERIVLDDDDPAMADRAAFLIGDAQSLLGGTQTLTRERSLKHLGKSFREVIEAPPHVADADVGRELLQRFLFPHLSDVDGLFDGDDNERKFNLCVEMIRRVYALADGRIAAESVDGPSQWEVLLPGALFAMTLKERSENWLKMCAASLGKALTGAGAKLDDMLVRQQARKLPSLGDRLVFMLATGTVLSDTGLDMMQYQGFSIAAEKINYLRFMSHFRALHRGTFFTTMRTTAVRKLLPESWGFLCPVHTPDGAPCGLLNHLAGEAVVAQFPPDIARLRAQLTSLAYTLGVADTAATLVRVQQWREQRRAAPATAPLRLVPVLVEGALIGYVEPAAARTIVQRLRALKREPRWHAGTPCYDAAAPREDWRVSDAAIPATVEVAYVPNAPGGAVGPPTALSILASGARLMRPVRSLVTKRVELIGALEQVFMDVACGRDTLRPGVTTHVELTATAMLSDAARLTPFSDFNQSPRNMYQCQMAKQTLGTAAYAYEHRVDSKLYRLLTPQAPVTRTRDQRTYRLNNYAHGFNAVVAVIAYTGYDMEDAMIICKSSMERGMAHGSLYSTKVVLLEPHQFFANERNNALVEYDGLPLPGQRLVDGSSFYSYWDAELQKYKMVAFSGVEPVIITAVRAVGKDTSARCRVATITYRRERNPVIGDKFSSRHGQKGTLAQLYPQINMPVSESGIQPDIIINPHAFPSRMTIGMLVESLAGKAGALHGRFQDASPFTFGAEAGDISGERGAHEVDAVAYFGEQLRAAGFGFHGTEPMYSGVSGEEMQVQIFQGVVYYQRLRHMVKDKFQVRSAGPVHAFTHQPVKGRKRGGGIRFGEMERDSLISHGAAFLLNDRLMRSSDASQCFACAACGSLLSVASRSPTAVDARPSCIACQSPDAVRVLSVPFVLRYLVNELAAMNVKVKIDIQ